ncbi:hypothetical protein BH18ACT7_BH18ACT7_00960 [soil metagenome]
MTTTRPRDGAVYRDVVETMLVFARTLRAAGVEAGPDRVQALVAALGELDVLDQSQVYWAGRYTLCSGPDDLERYDAAFAAFFGGERPHRGGRPSQREQTAQIASLDVDQSGAGQDSEPGAPEQHAVASGE